MRSKWYSATDRKLGNGIHVYSLSVTQTETIFIANKSTRNNVIWAWCSVLNSLPQLVHLQWLLFVAWIRLRHWLQLQDEFLLGWFRLLGGGKALNTICEVLKDGRASLKHSRYKLLEITLISSTQNTFLLYVITILENVDSNAILTCYILDKSVHFTLPQFTQLYEWVPGYRQWWILYTNNILSLNAEWMNTLQRSTPGSHKN